MRPAMTDQYTITSAASTSPAAISCCAARVIRSLYKVAKRRRCSLPHTGKATATTRDDGPDLCARSRPRPEQTDCQQWGVGARRKTVCERTTVQQSSLKERLLSASNARENQVWTS